MRPPFRPANIEALFEFGRQSRRELREFIEVLPAEEGDAPREFKLMKIL